MIEQEITTAVSTTFGNGRRRSGFAGRHHTEETRKNIRQGLKRARERKEKEGRRDMDSSDKWTELLRLRGARMQTIAQLSGSPDDEDEKNKKGIDFARELLRKGLISDDTTSWQSLVLHYSKNKRKLASFFDMLRLEVFYKGIQEARNGDLTLINLYKDTGYKIDSAFDTNLSDEEDYVAGLIFGKPEGVNADELGYYRVDEDGERWRELASGDGGSGIIYDSPTESTKRKIMRNFVPQGVR